MSLDYADWVRRGVAFVSGLPDRIAEPVSVSLCVEPPPTIDEGLPEDFYQPLGDARYAAALASLPVALQPLYVEGATRLECTYSVGRLCGGPQWEEPEVAAREMTEALGQAAVPFVRIYNGDWLAFLADSGAVAYLCHDGDDFVLATSLDAFLTEWARCCYVGPEWWELKPFRDEAGVLSGDTDAAVALRQRLGVAE